MEEIDLIRDVDKFTDKDGNIILRIIDDKMYKYIDGNYILYKKYKNRELNISDDLLLVAKEMYEAINYTLNYDNRENREKDDYPVTFQYPMNNLSFQKLLNARESYKKLKRGK